MQENEVKFGEKNDNSQKRGFFIDISEATVRDFHLNPVRVKFEALNFPTHKNSDRYHPRALLSWPSIYHCSKLALQAAAQDLLFSEMLRKLITEMMFSVRTHSRWI